MFVVCGEALFDLFATEGAGGLAFDARIGGSPFNVAVGLSRLGQPAALLTGLSTDTLGRRLLAALEAEGVATGYIQRMPNPTTLSVVDLGPDGSPAYAFYGAGAADRSLEAAPPLAEDATGLHFGSYALVVEPVGAALLALARREARRRLITLDPNVRPTVEPDLALWRARVADFAAAADLIKVSEEDLEILYPGRAAAAIAADWRAAGAAIVVVTRGERGAVAHGAFGVVETPGVAVDVADAVGAGDTFQAALISALAETGHASRAALEAMDAAAVARVLGFAARAAAITCGRRGADLPRRSELPALAP